MTEADLEKLETVVAADDETFRTELADALVGLDDDAALAQLLTEHPDAFEAISTRIATVDDPGEMDDATVGRAMDVIFGGMRLIAEQSPEVREAVTSDFTVNWDVDDRDLGWHMETDADAGRIDGGAGTFEDATLTFAGPLDVLLSMTGDEEFDATLAFIQNRYELVGPIEKGRELSSMMETVRANARDLA